MILENTAEVEMLNDLLVFIDQRDVENRHTMIADHIRRTVSAYINRHDREISE